jgi:hypothetical protein
MPCSYPIPVKVRPRFFWRSAIKAIINCAAPALGSDVSALIEAGASCIIMSGCASCPALPPVNPLVIFAIGLSGFAAAGAPGTAAGEAIAATGFDAKEIPAGA